MLKPGALRSGNLIYLMFIFSLVCFLPCAEARQDPGGEVNTGFDGDVRGVDNSGYKGTPFDHTYYGDDERWYNVADYINVPPDEVDDYRALDGTASEGDVATQLFFPENAAGGEDGRHRARMARDAQRAVDDVTRNAQMTAEDVERAAKNATYGDMSEGEQWDDWDPLSDQNLGVESGPGPGTGGDVQGGTGDGGGLPAPKEGGDSATSHRPDGSSVTSTENADGSHTVTTHDAQGNVTGQEVVPADGGGAFMVAVN